MAMIDPERRVRLTEAALAARVSRQLVYSWVRRGLLVPLAPEAGEEAARYRLGDVLNVNASTLRSGCSSRAKSRVPLSRIPVAEADRVARRVLSASATLPVAAFNSSI